MRRNRLRLSEGWGRDGDAPCRRDSAPIVSGVKAATSIPELASTSMARRRKLRFDLKIITHPVEKRATRILVDKRTGRLVRDYEKKLFIRPKVQSLRLHFQRGQS
jgi:hypothetical protein